MRCASSLCLKKRMKIDNATTHRHTRTHIQTGLDRHTQGLGISPLSVFILLQNFLSHFHSSYINLNSLASTTSSLLLFHSSLSDNTILNPTHPLLPSFTQTHGLRARHPTPLRHVRQRLASPRLGDYHTRVADLPHHGIAGAATRPRSRS